MMAGLTSTYFRPNDFCYIVLYTPLHFQREEPDFLEGLVSEVGPQPTEIPHHHPIWRFPQVPPKSIYSIRAMVLSDPREGRRHPVDPIRVNEEPGRHYLVVHPQECVRYLLGEVERKEKMNAVQYERIRSLEAVLQHYQSRSFK